MCVGEMVAADLKYKIPANQIRFKQITQLIEPVVGQ
jgi:hypothetical protein